MKTFLRLTLITFLFVAAGSECFALMGIRSITPAKAKELGILVRAQPNGPDHAWVQMEFRPEGELKEFLRVSLEIRDGEKLLFGWSALETKKSEKGNLTVASFLVDRAFLDKVTLQIVTGQPLNYNGTELRLGEFVDSKQLDSQSPDKNSGAKDGAPTAPASAR